MRITRSLRDTLRDRDALERHLAAVAASAHALAGTPPPAASPAPPPDAVPPPAAAPGTRS